MRIAFDPQIFQFQKFGGISRYFSHLADEFGQRSVDVGIIAPSLTNTYIQDLPPHLIKHSTVNNWIDRLPKRIRRRSVQRKDRIIRKMMAQWNPDIVHETYFRNESYAPKGTPVVLTIYDMIHERYPEMFSPQDTTRKQKQEAAKRAEHVICISHSTRNDLLHFHEIEEEKVSVVHLGFDQLDNTTSEEEATPPEFPFLLFVGNRDRYKNFDGFLKAYSSSPSLKKDFLIISFGGIPFSKDELDTISDLGLDSSRIIQRSGSDFMLARLYETATAFVYPSLFEGFGLPPLEAMAKKCPVVVGNTSCLPEILGDAAEYFNPSSVESMRAAIEKVAYDSDRKHELVLLGIERLKRYSWRKCADETLDVYKRLVS